MPEAIVTVRMPQELRDRLEAISHSTRRPESLLAMEAIARYVESEEEAIEGIKEAREEIRAGLGIPHDEVMRAGRALIMGTYGDK